MTLIGITMGGPDLEARVRAALGAGARVLIRELTLPDFAMPGLILHARMPGAEARAREAGLGLHLSEGMDLLAIRRRFDGELGVSTHSPAEADAARAMGADHVFLSPIWPPSSKEGRPPLGVAQVTGRIALGGITPARARECAAHGAVGVAAMGGIFGRPGAEAEAVAAYRTALGI